MLPDVIGLGLHKYGKSIIIASIREVFEQELRSGKVCCETSVRALLR